MREIRTSGSEGGVAQPNAPSLPLLYRKPTCVIPKLRRSVIGLAMSLLRNLAPPLADFSIHPPELPEAKVLHYLSRGFDSRRRVSYERAMNKRYWLGSLLALLNFHLLAADAPKTFKVAEFNFARPAKWEWIDVTSSMRKAQLKVPGTDKNQNAEVVFFYFGEGNGGGTKANVDRWLG